MEAAPSRAHWIALAAILAVAAALRIAVIAATPNFFSPGDPAVYFAMARGCLIHGVPRIDFVWNFLGSSPRISHVENYYEPAFAYLLALPMLFTGAKVVTAQSVSVVAGLVTVVLVYRAARRFSPATALVAAGLVALEPWSIWYGGLLMKEAAVAAVVLIFFEAMLGLTQAPTPPRRNGVLLGGATIAASLIQYELLLILSATCVVVLCVHRRGLLLPYLATLVAGIGALVGVTQAALGVPISSKVAYLLGGSLWNPGVASQHMPSLARFLPIPYVPASVVGASYPSLFILAAAGAVAGRAPRPVVTTVAAFTGSFLYFHGIASDLWPRDFVVLTPVVLPFAAVALTEFARWRTRSWALAAALAVLVFGAFAPWSNPAFRQVPWDAEVEVLWGAMTPAIVAGTLALLVGWLLHRRIRLERLGPAIAVALGLALLAQFEFSLPPRTIYRNEIVRNYERLRSERERIGARLGQSIPGATVMAADPWEISLYSGLKSVLIPLDRQSESVRAVQAQYGAQYFLELDPGPPPAFLRAIGAREVDRLEDYRLYRFEGPDVGAPALPSAAFSPSPAPATRRSTNR